MAYKRTLQIGKVWSKTDRNGKPYLSIALDGPVIIADPDRFELVAFANENRETDTSPDYRLCLTERQARGGDRDFEGDTGDEHRDDRDRRPADPPPRNAARGGRYDDDTDDPFASESRRPPAASGGRR